MSVNEASYIIKKSEENYMNDWNKTRYIMYSVLQSQSTTIITPSDVLEFPWEKKKEEISNLPVKTRDELIKHALEMQNKLNENGTIKF